MIKIWLILASIIGIILLILAQRIFRLYVITKDRSGQFLLSSVVTSCLVCSLVVYHFLGEDQNLAQKMAFDQEISQLIKIGVKDQLPQNQMLIAEASIIKLKDRILNNHLDSKAWFLLGQMYGILNQWPDAIAALTMAGKLEPHNTEYQTRLSYAYGKHKQSQLITSNQVALKEE